MHSFRSSQGSAKKHLGYIESIQAKPAKKLPFFSENTLLSAANRAKSQNPGKIPWVLWFSRYRSPRAQRQKVAATSKAAPKGEAVPVFPHILWGDTEA